MRKLISSNLFRLWKDKVFWIAVVSTFICNLINVLSGVKLAIQEPSDFTYTLDYYCYGYLPMFGMAAAAFVSLFHGTEYGDGTLRNKLIVGHTRVKVYLANLLTNYVGSAIILMAGFLAGVAGIPVLGWFEMDSTVLVNYLVISLLMAAAWCAFFTLISTLIANRAYGVVFCLLFWLGFTFLGSYFYNVLSEPEMHSGAIVTGEGVVMGEPALNPAYIDGLQRQVYEFLIDFFPSAQAIQMSNLEAIHPVRMMLCSVGITVIITLSGVLGFRRKDLK